MKYFILLRKSWIRLCDNFNVLTCDMVKSITECNSPNNYLESVLKCGLVNFMYSNRNINVTQI